VPKAHGFINIGLGGMSDRLKRKGGHIRDHWSTFARKLHKRGLVRHDHLKPTGYSYYLRGDVEVVRDDNAFIAGDAVGLATLDMCEGIGPAVRSGLLAARAIATGADYSLAEIGKYSGSGFGSRLLARKISGA
jgi:flavin-dependent dehydrogenase